MKRRKIVNIFIVLIIFLFICMLSTPVFAARYAISLATDFGRTVLPSGNILTGNFLSTTAYSQMAYNNISDITSLRNTAFTKAYLIGTTPNGEKRLETNVIFLNGHGNSDNMVFCHQGNSAYATGICLGQDFNDGFFDYVGLNTLNMYKTRLVTYCACKTGEGNNNLVTASINRGAKVAVGFNDTIWTGQSSAGEEWLKFYHDALGNGLYINSAIGWANSNVPNSGMDDTIVTEGPTRTTNLQQSNVSSLELDERKNIVDTNNINKIKFKDKFLVNELSYQCDILEEIEDKNLNDYEETFSFLINEIKQMDENFNINDYKVTSHFYNKNDKNGFIKFTYYINGNIETNKVYIANIEDGVIINVILAGINKNNLINIENVNTQNLILKLNKYEIQNTTKDIDVIFEKYKNKDDKKMIIEYYYDFNTNILKKFEKIEVKDDSNIIMADLVTTVIE